MSATYIIIPGSVTGDLWHVAAAQILSSEYDKTFPSLIAVVAVTARKADDSPQDITRKTEEWDKGRVTFNYLRFIGRQVMLLKLIGTNAGTPMIEQILHSQPKEWFDQAYKAQTGEHPELKEGRLLEGLDFDQLSALNVVSVTKADLDTNSNQKIQPFPKLQPFPNTLPPGNRVLQLKMATTIAMNLLQDKSTRSARRKFLTKRMYSGSPDYYLPQPTLAAAEAKLSILRNLVSGLKKNPKITGVILENYRQGHVNGGTDTTPELSTKLQSLAKAQNRGVIGILAVTAETGYTTFKSRYKTPDVVFDFYNKLRTNPPNEPQWVDSPWPGLEARAQAYFWCKVAEEKLIDGVIGGRSGSLDLAAFCGVKVLFWDEPWIQYACRMKVNPDEPPQEITENRTSTAVVQIPQCLRSQQLMLLMGTALPLRVGINYGNFNVDVTAGDMAAYQVQPPSVDDLKNWILKSSLQDMRKDLERTDLVPAIKANVIDDWLQRKYEYVPFTS